MCSPNLCSMSTQARFKSPAIILNLFVLLVLGNASSCKLINSSETLKSSILLGNKRNSPPSIDLVLKGNHPGNDQFPVVYSINQFAARISGGFPRAQHLAENFNLKLVKQIFPNSNYFLFEQFYIDERDKLNHTYLSVYLSKNSDKLTEKNPAASNSRKSRLRRSIDYIELDKLKSDPVVEWVQQQIPLSRKKRDFVDYYSSEENFDQSKGKSSDLSINKNNANNQKESQSNSDENGQNIKLSDPMWSKLWYINPQEKLTNSMRIKEAWKMGYTGKNVIVTILDDGLEWDHPDIIKNYDPKASLDINDNDNDPRPRYDRYNYNKHGTRCAGEIAAEADNKVCSVGVAYNSRIGGIRMLDGEVTDLVEATALSYNRDYIDIYSASWGPDDDGKTVDGPGFLALKAIEDGIKYGRRGLGSIYVWASGNGGKDDDNCNCDGYTNSIYTISVSSATQNGNIPWYSEACSSTIASTFSSGSYEERQIITTDLRKSCTEAHTGTSASAPLAAGIIALTLEANPELSWRDIQHVIVETARPENLSSADWQVNGAGRKVSHSFGYGMMDAVGMIELAKRWVSVPHQRKCVIESSKNGHHQKPILIPKGDRLIIELFSTGCKGSKNEINYLEHVQAVISVQSNTRGTLVVTLRSPMGTNSTLLDRRMLDQSAEMFNKWPFTSVHMWGEKPQGTWVLEIKNNAKNTTYINLNLILYGTRESPHKRDVSANSASQSSSAKKQHHTLNTTNAISNLKPMTEGKLSKDESLVNQDQRNRKTILLNLQQTSFGPFSSSSSSPSSTQLKHKSSKIFAKQYQAENSDKLINQQTYNSQNELHQNPLKHHKPKFKLVKSSTYQPTTLTTTTTSITTTTHSEVSSVSRVTFMLIASSNSKKYDYYQLEADDLSISGGQNNDADYNSEANEANEIGKDYNDLETNESSHNKNDGIFVNDEEQPIAASNVLIGQKSIIYSKNNGNQVQVSHERSSSPLKIASAVASNSSAAEKRKSISPLLILLILFIQYCFIRFF